ncbi:hypothetical protein [Paraflavitalea speifideaquila]|uniref:hypothetical protein n=1 Tax=Paraflavitalea speifideaquila TaxID=3076558 RepID=UPI0028E1ADF3|nr:hypothetical protein [Paraflavitalea speifideiaquila]
MKRNRAIRLKAFFLLAVFVLNTLVGFACAVGLDMGFNTKHHHHDDPIAANITHRHDEGVTLHHNHHEEADNAKKSATDDNCCNNDVIRFTQLDKLLAHAVNTSIEAPAILVYFHFLYQSYISPFTQRTRQLQVVRPYVESSRGIRVSIQSFQI